MTSIRPSKLEPAYAVERMTGALLPLAARRLMASASSRKDAATSFLDAADLMGMSLKGFWGSVSRRAGQDPEVREVALAVSGSGGALLMFTSEPRGSAGEAELAEVITQACAAGVRQERARMAQALLMPRERGAERAFVAAGFREIAELAYLRRPAGLPAGHGLDGPAVDWTGVQVTRVADLPGGYRGSQGRLVRALERSYEGTLDCPELCTMRSAQEALEGHRASGEFDPNLWWLIESEGAPVGAMLFSPSPPHETVELVYLGLGPEVRGRGLGRGLLRMGLESACVDGMQWVTCAVDLRNHPARKLYVRAGFRRSGLRRALVRALTE